MPDLLDKLKSISFYGNKVLADHANGEQDDLYGHLHDLLRLTESALELCGVPECESSVHNISELPDTETPLEGLREQSNSAQRPAGEIPG